MSTSLNIAVLGAGVVGASWTAVFLANGHRVAVHDPAADTRSRVQAQITSAWPILRDLDLIHGGDPEAVTFHDTAAGAAAGADFIQENIPERLDLKHAVYAGIEPVLKPGAIIASSTSGITLTALQTGWRDPSRLVIGHPFNPPHLIPLVEVMGNDRTAPGIVESVEAFYASVGKVTIRLRREVPGHVANRLQAAVFREAIHLVKSGVASVEDVDKAVHASLGLRWAAMGPTMLLSLAGGPGGLPAFFDHLAPSFETWWADLGAPHLDADTMQTMIEGQEQAKHGASHAELAARRDREVAAVRRALAEVRRAEPG